MSTLRKLELMHRLFRSFDGHICRECNNFQQVRYHDKPLKKCAVYGDTRSEASDWAGRWPACGMFNKEYTGTPVIRLIQREKKKSVQSGEPLEGQMALEV